MLHEHVEGHALVLELDRPEARNAIDGESARALEAAIDRLEEDASLWVGVLGAKGPVFCAGADLRAIAEGRMAELSTERGGFAGFVARDRRKPVIAAVDGPALAGGLEIILAADLVVASRAARFGLPEASRSLVAAAGGLFRLPRVIPPTVAMGVILAGDQLDGARAFDVGLVNRLVEPGEALSGAIELAEAVARNAPLAVQASLRIARRAVASAEDERALFRESARAMADLMATSDFAEGPRAFLEKRPPSWQGR
jgi:enoyl-CoA hydratase